MIKMIAAISRRPGMTHAECIAYIHRVHGRISRENRVTLTRYVQNHVFDAAFGCATDVVNCMPLTRDSVTELYWDSFEAMGQTFADEGVRTKVGPDGRNFADVSASLSLVATEVEQLVSHPSASASAKVLYFLRCLESLSLETFFDRWAKAHAYAMEAEPLAAACVRRCVHNQQEPKANPMLAYFNAKGDAIYEGVASLWFDDASTIGAFRTYERAFLAFNARNDSRFFDPTRSFFVYANEVTILGGN